MLKQRVLAIVGELLLPLGLKDKGRGVVAGLLAALLRITPTAKPHSPHPLVFCQYPPSLNLSQSRGWERPEDSHHRLRLSEIRAG